MLRRVVLCWSLISICLGWIGHGFAQTTQTSRGGKVTSTATPMNGDTYAIVIGISKYKNVPVLQYADRDAQAFEDFLLSDAGGKIPAAHIETFLNDNATRTNIGDAISETARKVKPGDRLYFFFAGHGDMEDLTQIENGLLLLYNSPNGNYFGMNDDVLEILDLKRYLSPLASRGIDMIFIVDACHSGNLKGGVEGSQQTAAALAMSWGKEFKILSCQPSQLSLESAEWGGGRGLFSYQLEEGMKGMADTNNDGIVSLFELQSYIQANVAKYSEGKQIPLISGDLSKAMATVNPPTLAALRQEQANNYPMLAVANSKGDESKYLDSLDPSEKKLYLAFNQQLEEKKLIWPADTNALHTYRIFAKHHAENPVTTSMRRRLAVALNERFNTIVSPLLKGRKSYSSREECYYTSAELDSCLALLGETHYMYNNIKARSLYMKAMSLTWALSESDNKVSTIPVVKTSIRLLLESEALEPNASYTLEHLGTCYFFVLDFDKANLAFKKYLDLRPNDYYAKYSLGKIYRNLKQYDKAETLFERLLKEDSLAQDPEERINLYAILAEIYVYDNKKEQARAYTQKILDGWENKVFGYSKFGDYYSMTDNIDSAIYYYKLSEVYRGSNSTDNNNIGYLYVLNGNMDSARHYLYLAIANDAGSDFSIPHPWFNLATIDVLGRNYKAAITNFKIAIDKSSISSELFMQNFQIYFNKEYHVTDSALYKDFKNITRPFNVRYISYLCILYCYLRDQNLAGAEGDEKIEKVFSRLNAYPQYEATTSYHYACYKSIRGDHKAALAYIEKALEQGFGDYFALIGDADLDRLRDEPQFKALLKKYFPDAAHSVSTNAAQ
jgi:uncharacterized caspase-like protein/Flp pilus assembly protein TadD